MKKIIINADDFGLTRGCNQGIIEAMKNGIVTSTTLMINMPAAEEAVELAKENHIESIGLHLTLTCGKPVSPTNEVPSLVKEEGDFYTRSNQLLPVMNLKEVEHELRNQIKAFLNTGLKLSHFDGHHHIHMYEGIREIVANLAKEFDVPLRQPNGECRELYQEMGIKTTDHFTWDFYGDKATMDNLINIIDDFNGETLEIMVHPAFVDEELMKRSSYHLHRENEFKILTSMDVKDLLKERELQLISFLDLRD